MLDKLDILEQKIKKLLEQVNGLKQEKKDLEVRLKEREGEITGLKNDMENLLTERDRIKEKVTHLIKSVEDF